MRKQGDTPRRDRGSRAKDRKDQDVDFVNTISGEPTLAEDSNQAQKVHSLDPTLLYNKYEVNLVVGLLKIPQMPTTPVMFTEDTKDVVYPHDDVQVMTLWIANKDVAKILVDTWSSVDILSKNALYKLGLAAV